jgi:hypothetical protein
VVDSVHVPGQAGYAGKNRPVRALYPSWQVVTPEDVAGQRFVFSSPGQGHYGEILLVDGGIIARQAHAAGKC